MGKWDRPSSGGDKGDDKPPVPKVPAYEPPPARYERSPAEQSNRDGPGRYAEGTRPKDKPPEQGTRGREGTGAGGDANRENATVPQSLFDQQGKIIEAYRERSNTFQAEVTTLRERNETLEDRLEHSSLTIAQLRTELAMARKNDRPAESQPAADTEPDNRRPPAAPEQPGTRDRPRLPGVIGDSGNQSRVPGAVGDPPADLRLIQASASNENNGPRRGGGEKTGHGDSGGGGRGPDTGGGAGGDGSSPDGPNAPKPPDGPHEPTGSSETGDSAEIKRYESLFQRQDKLIGRMEKELEAKDAEIGRLKGRVTELESRDKPAAGQTDVGNNALSGDGRDQHQKHLDRPWYKRLPDPDTIAFGSTLEALGQLWAANQHMINGSTEGYIAGGVAAGVAGYKVVKNLITKHFEKDKDEKNAG